MTGGTEALLREADLRQWLGMSKSTLRRWIVNGDFPAGIKVSARITLWRERDIRAWLLSKEESRR